MQVPTKCTGLNLSLLYILILKIHGKFASKTSSCRGAHDVCTVTQHSCGFCGHYDFRNSVKIFLEDVGKRKSGSWNNQISDNAIFQFDIRVTRYFSNEVVGMSTAWQILGNTVSQVWSYLFRAISFICTVVKWTRLRFTKSRRNLTITTCCEHEACEIQAWDNKEPWYSGPVFESWRSTIEPWYSGPVFESWRSTIKNNHIIFWKQSYSQNAKKNNVEEYFGTK